MALHRPKLPRGARGLAGGGGLLVAGTLLVAAACGPSSEARSAEPEAPSAPSGEETATAHALAPGGGDMETLNDASDLVVHGTVVAAQPDVRIGPPDLTYTVFTVEVEETLAGEAAERVEVALSTRANGLAVDLHGRPEPAVGDSGVWFLDEIDPEFGREGYVLAGMEGLVLVDEEDGTVGEGLADDSPLLAEVEEAGSPEDVVDHARSVVE